MNEQNNTITLYPSNWLYNAGVIGLLLVQQYARELDMVLLTNEGSFSLPSKYFENKLVDKINISRAIINLVNYIVSDAELTEWLSDDKENETTLKKSIKKKSSSKKKESNVVKYARFQEELGNFGYRFVRAGNKLFASKTPYQNLIQLSEWQSYEYSSFVNRIPEFITAKEFEKCKLCNQYPIVFDKESKLETRLAKLQSTHLKGLGPSIGEFPNSFWNMDQSIGICPLCSFLIIHHHLTFTRLSDNSEVFINAPSFKLMYELNMLAKEVYGNKNAIETKSKREILAQTMVEYSNKINTSLGVWSEMNIEIVSKRNDFIEFFSLPYNVVKIITDRNIAAIIADLGENRIYNRILDEKFYDLINLAQRLLKLSTKDQLSSNDLSIINDLLYQQKNKNNLTSTVNKILKLYSLIEDKLKRN